MILGEVAWKALRRPWVGGKENKTVDICKQHDFWQSCVGRAMSKWSCLPESVRQQSLVVTGEVGLESRRAGLTGVITHLCELF